MWRIQNNGSFNPFYLLLIPLVIGLISIASYNLKITSIVLLVLLVIFILVVIIVGWVKPEKSEKGDNENND